MLGSWSVLSDPNQHAIEALAAQHMITHIHCWTVHCNPRQAYTNDFECLAARQHNSSGLVCVENEMLCSSCYERALWIFTDLVCLGHIFCTRWQEDTSESKLVCPCKQVVSIISESDTPDNRTSCQASPSCLAAVLICMYCCFCSLFQFHTAWCTCWSAVGTSCMILLKIVQQRSTYYPLRNMSLICRGLDDGINISACIIQQPLIEIKLCTLSEKPAKHSLHQDNRLLASFPALFLTGKWKTDSSAWLTDVLRRCFHILCCNLQRTASLSTTMHLSRVQGGRTYDMNVSEAAVVRNEQSQSWEGSREHNHKGQLNTVPHMLH